LLIRVKALLVVSFPHTIYQILAVSNDDSPMHLPLHAEMELSIYVDISTITDDVSHYVHEIFSY